MHHISSYFRAHQDRRNKKALKLDCIQNHEAFLGRLLFNEYNKNYFVSVYVPGEDYPFSLNKDDIPEMQDLNFLCVTEDHPSFHLVVPLASREFSPEPKQMMPSASYRLTRTRDGQTVKSHFKNVKWLEEQRIFHGVIDCVDSLEHAELERKQDTFDYYTFQISEDFTSIVRGQIESYGSIDPNQFSGDAVQVNDCREHAEIDMIDGHYYISIPQVEANKPQASEKLG